MSSNVSLPIEVYRFLKKSLIAIGFNGYFDIDWAGSAGSGRSFYRIFIGRNITLILMVWDGEDSDWDYFLDMIHLPFSEKVLPRVRNFDRKLGAVLLEDAGFRQLKDLFRGVYSTVDKRNALKTVFENLQVFRNANLAGSAFVVKREYDLEHALWESSYFKEHVLGAYPDLAGYFDSGWAEEVRGIAKAVTALDKMLMHRDFQSENILVKDHTISFVDFQGARLGPVEYDVASLLFDPYIYNAIGEELRIELLTHCCFLFGIKLDNIYLAATQRLMQAIGAYYNLSRNKGKKRYVRFVKPALEGLHFIFERSIQYPKLTALAAQLLEKVTN